MTTDQSNPHADDSPDTVMTVHAKSALATPFTSHPSEMSMMMQSEQPSGPDLMVYLHALRRRWMLALALGILTAAIIGPAVWLLSGPRYTATAYLQVQPAERNILPSNADMREYAAVQNAYEIFKDTQQQIIKSRFVITAALRNPVVQNQESIKREDAARNALTWYTKNLSVGFPLKGEIMQVSMTGKDPNEMRILVNGIVQAYMEEVVNRETSVKKLRLDALDRSYAEKEDESRRKRAELKQLAESLGTSDTETLSLKQQIAVQQFAEYRKELTRMQFELARAKGQLKAQQSLLQGTANLEISEFEVEALASSNRISQQIADALAMTQLSERQNEAAAVPGSKTSSYLQHNRRSKDSLQDQYDELQKSFRERVRGMKRAEIEKEVRRAEAEISILTEQEEQFHQDVERQRKEAEATGRGSVDVEMTRTEVRHLDQILNSIAEERERLKVERRSTPRIQIMGDPKDPAELPDNEAGRPMRIALSFASMLAAFCLPVVGLIAWDIRAKRINGSAEVTKGLGLRVIGSVPMIPPRVISRLGLPSKRNQLWRLRLTESVDGLAARVLRKGEFEGTRVLLVSSAMSGEGKTTLATQLAMSLARNLRRTILVDFDLRRPALDGVFGLPLEGGVCDVLRGQTDLTSLVHPTSAEYLSVMTAGRWDRPVLAALANGAAARLLEQLKANYDFVILDSSPILPVADTRFVSQHVDSVVLSVFRDISEGPKVLAACEILEAFGVQTIEAVVTGEHAGGYGKGMDYSSETADDISTVSDRDGEQDA